eukprot:354157-Chlamydomonas_euryale.AAC.13
MAHVRTQVVSAASAQMPRWGRAQLCAVCICGLRLAGPAAMPWLASRWPSRNALACVSLAQPQRQGVTFATIQRRAPE